MNTPITTAWIKEWAGDSPYADPIVIDAAETMGQLERQIEAMDAAETGNASFAAACVDDAQAAPGSGFFIVNTTDRPSEEHIAERRADGKFYYAHPRLKNVKSHWGMTPTNPTPIEAFGMRVAVMDGMLYCVTDPHLEATATYSDGRPRKWQGARRFEFRFQND